MSKFYSQKLLFKSRTPSLLTEFFSVTKAFLSITTMSNSDQERNAMVTPVRSAELPDERFSTLKTKPVVASLIGMIDLQQGRQKVKRFLVQGVCDKYQGAYDPHYLTGLGSALWVVDQYWQDAPLVANSLVQYVDFFFSGMRS